MSPDYIIDFLYNVVDFFKKENIQKFSIKKTFLINNRTSVLKVIISPKGDQVPPTDRILIKRLYKKGYSCLYYYISGSVLSTDVNETLSNFDQIKNEIRQDISKYKKEYNFERIDMISSSLGNVSACLVTNGNDDINNLYLIVPGSCIASSLWHGIRTENLRSIYEEQEINEIILKDLWRSLDPKNNINALKGKNIFLAITKCDKVIPYTYGKEFVNQVQITYPDNTFINENVNLGHYFTVIKYYIFSDELLK